MSFLIFVVSPFTGDFDGFLDIYLLGSMVLSGLRCGGWQGTCRLTLLRWEDDDECLSSWFRDKGSRHDNFPSSTTLLTAISLTSICVDGGIIMS